MALDYGDLPGVLRATESCTHRCCTGRSGDEAQECPALSGIAENKIMGEMNGGARQRAAGEGVEAATNNTMYRLSDGVWMDRMAGGTDRRTPGQHGNSGGTPARCKAGHWDTSLGY